MSNFELLIVCWEVSYQDHNFSKQDLPFNFAVTKIHVVMRLGEDGTRIGTIHI